MKKAAPKKEKESAKKATTAKKPAAPKKEKEASEKKPVAKKAAAPKKAAPKKAPAAKKDVCQISLPLLASTNTDRPLLSSRSLPR